MTVKKGLCCAACVLRLDDVILLTGLSFTKDVTLCPHVFLSIEHNVRVSNALFHRNVS